MPTDFKKCVRQFFPEFLVRSYVSSKCQLINTAENTTTNNKELRKARMFAYKHQRPEMTPVMMTD
jgi:hypothetical protein